MPYIRKEKRVPLLSGSVPDNAGELNFQITSLITQYIRKHILSYSTLNDVLGALEGCKLELYRRVVAPYEDKKIKENGDVYK